MLATAIGYTGDARYIAINWTPYGDEAEYNDGRISATGNWQALFAYIHHPAVSPLLADYDLGSSESEAKHALILDREELEVFIASVNEAERFLKEQWPLQPPIRMNQEEYMAKISIALKNIKPSSDIDFEYIQRRTKERDSLIEDMQQWLDKFLKN
jgi:hypothetical protein